MTAENSVTLWINQLQAGDSRAAQGLWELYFQRMVSLAKKQLTGAPRRIADEEDVALSAFKSFCLGAQDGRFTDVTDRTNLWPLLVAITAHKAVDLIKSENRKKRGGTGSADSTTTRPERVALEELFANAPTPEFTAQIADEFAHLMERLDTAGDPHLQQIAILKMEGFKNGEIAAQLECARRTVERKLQMIATMWNRETQL
ncbi:MAG: ECF-type sigma factor [Planctomycetaceae bacterium]